MRGTPLFCEREFPKIPFTAYLRKTVFPGAKRNDSNVWLFTFMQRSVFILGLLLR